MSEGGGGELVPVGSAEPGGADDDPTPPSAPALSWRDRTVAGGHATIAWTRENSPSVCLALTIAAMVLYTLVFSSLAVENYHNFGNWAYDMAIYDQAFWLVSQFGDTFMTVRGMDVWGHHITLIAYLFAPFYRLGAGPEFLVVVQTVGLALGALPVYLIAKLRLGRPSLGLLFACAYLMYAPMQNINWRDFHPEALVIAPFLFAWYCAMRRRWRWFFVCLVLAMAMREDAALAVVMMGVVLLITERKAIDRGKAAKMAAGTIVLGLAWYGIATQVIIPHFNDGDSAFYMKFFYGRWGGSFSGVVENMIRHPNRVVSDAVQHDRLKFYKQLVAPLAGLPLLSPVHLLMAAPQLLASVIGDSPYARTILYQYTSVIVGPMMIASIEGARNLWRIRWNRTAVRSVTVIALIFASYTTNIAWSPSPVSDSYAAVWARNNPYAPALEQAVALIPDDASVSSTFNLGPHLAQRRESFDWPNPFWPSYWGKEVPSEADCDNFPSASVVDYLALDMNLIGGDPNTVALIEAMTGPDGDFEIVDQDLYDTSKILVARRIEPGPDGEPLPPNCSPEVPRPGTGLGTLSGMLEHYQTAIQALPAEDLPELTLPGDGERTDDSVPGDSDPADSDPADSDPAHTSKVD